MASICLPDSYRKRHEECFQTARNSFDFAFETVREAQSVDNLPFPIIGPETDSAYATGYHSAGMDTQQDNSHIPTASMSRYNAYREGFIFSNGDMFNVEVNSPTILNHTGVHSSFDESMSTLFHSMHDDIACPILVAIAKYLNLPDIHWFQATLGPTILHSQWHLKRFVHPVPLPESYNELNKGEPVEWLPSHTDPSLISIVIHDSPDIVNGGLGLQYLHIPKTTLLDNTSTTPVKTIKVWKEIPRHGHGIATILVGSILSYITGHIFPSAKHRVIYSDDMSYTDHRRIAATLFVRPRGDALLVPPPSHRIVGLCNRKEQVIFSHWLKRVSRNYMNSTKKNEKKNAFPKEGQD